MFSVPGLAVPKITYWAQFSSCGFCEISKNTVFTEHLRATASERFTKYIIEKDHFTVQLSTPKRILYHSLGTILLFHYLLNKLSCYSAIMALFFTQNCLSLLKNNLTVLLSTPQETLSFT